MTAATVTQLRPQPVDQHPDGCRCVPCEIRPLVAALRQGDSAASGPRLVKVKDAGELLGVGKDLVYRLIRRGDLEAVRLDGCQLVVVESIDTYVARLRAES